MAACAVADLFGRDVSLWMRHPPPNLHYPFIVSLTEVCWAVECAFLVGALSGPRGGAGSGGHLQEW